MPSATLCASFIEVDHACQRCGTQVEDGRPFCPQCRAPQINVQVAVAEPPPAVREPISEAAFPHDARSNQNALRSSSSSAATSSNGPNTTVAVHAALKAGVLGVFISIIPLLGIALTGALAVYFYRRESGAVPRPAFAGRIGGAAGVVAFAINTLLLVIRIFVFHARQEYVDFLTQIAEKTGMNARDPDYQAILHNMLTPSGIAATFFFGMIFVVVLAAAGGALGTFFLQPDKRRK